MKIMIMLDSGGGSITITTRTQMLGAQAHTQLQCFEMTERKKEVMAFLASMFCGVVVVGRLVLRHKG